MTAAELRDLLERVAAHGGPVRLVRGPEGERVSIDPVDDRTLGVHMASVAGSIRYSSHLVGVLKRDLIERGMRFSILGGPDNFAVNVFRSSLDDKKDGAWATDLLEAVLRAWLAAAEAEGWTA